MDDDRIDEAVLTLPCTEETDADQVVARALGSSSAVSMRHDRRCAGAAGNPHAPENAAPATPTTIQPSAAAKVSAHHAEREIALLRRMMNQIQAPLPSGMASAKTTPKVYATASTPTLAAPSIAIGCCPCGTVPAMIPVMPPMAASVIGESVAAPALAAKTRPGVRKH